MSNKSLKQLLIDNEKEIIKKQNEIKKLKEKERKMKAEKLKFEKELHQKRLSECGAVLEKVDPNLIKLSNDELRKILTDVLSNIQTEETQTTLLECDENLNKNDKK